MGEGSGEGAIYPGGGARESLNGLCGEVEMTVHGKPQVMRAHPHYEAREGRTEGRGWQTGNEGVEREAESWEGEGERPKRDSGMPTPRPPSQAGRRQRERRAKMREATGWLVGRHKNEGGEEPRHILPFIRLLRKCIQKLRGGDERKMFPESCDPKRRARGRDASLPS